MAPLAPDLATPMPGWEALVESDSPMHASPDEKHATLKDPVHLFGRSHFINCLHLDREGRLDRKVGAVFIRKRHVTNASGLNQSSLTTRYFVFFNTAACAARILNAFLQIRRSYEGSSCVCCISSFVARPGSSGSLCLRLRTKHLRYFFRFLFFGRRVQKVGFHVCKLLAMQNI